MKKLLALILVLIIAFAAGFWTAGQVDDMSGVTMFERITGITLPRITQGSEVTEEAVKAKLSEMAELTTYSAEYTVTLGKNEVKRIKSFELGITRNSILITAGGIVKVGYDIESIDVAVDENVIYVTLPEKAKLNDNYVIWDTVECDEHNNIFNMIEFAQYYEIIEEIERLGLEKAEAEGIYESAAEQMKYLVEMALGAFDGYEVVVE